MVAKFVDILGYEMTQTIIERLIQTEHSSASLSKKISSPKFFMIDWRDANVEMFKLNLKRFTCDQLFQLLDTFNNREIFGIVYKRIETENEEYLWNQLVDCHIISDELYQKNTYDENLDILFKMTEFNLGK